MLKKQLLIFSLTGVFLLTPSTQYAAPKRVYIRVGQAKAKKSVIAFPKIKMKGPIQNRDALEKISKKIQDDLLFMDLFKFLPESAFIEKSDAGVAKGEFEYSDWKSIGTDFLIKSALTVEGQNLSLEGYLYDPSNAEQLLAKKYVARASDVETLAHTFANDIVERLTGLTGVFLTQIAMSCDRTGKKEIYVMDFDGSDVKQVTKHRSIAFAPAWSHDGTKLAYSLYTKRKNNLKNVDLFEYDMSNNSVRLLSNRRGINSGATYSPDGKKLLATMSFLGNPEIFILDVKKKNVNRLTRSFGFDVDPEWSPDGKTVAFVSSRTGQPMIFRMNFDGSGTKRLTYAGRYNATPSWSPTNNKIAFASWIDERFDLFIMNPDGTRIERLTKNQGSNEDPSISPDGNFIAFSSNRTGKKNIYVMNIDGTAVRRLTFGLGNCVTPKWSNPPPKAKVVPMPSD